MIATSIIELFWYEVTFHGAARVSHRLPATRQALPKVEILAVNLVVGASEESEVERGLD